MTLSQTQAFHRYDTDSYKKISFVKNIMFARACDNYCLAYVQYW